MQTPRRLHEKRRTTGQGFTLLELLVTVAIIGIIAVLIMPNLLDSLQKARQKRTLGDMRDVGLAWYSWLTDQVSAAAAGTQSTYDFGLLDSTLSAAELMSTLYTSPERFYIQDIPVNDSWGTEYHYAWAGTVRFNQVIGIRSLGRDMQADGGGDVYTMGPFNANEYERDIVWADGFFIRYPTGAQSQ